MGQSNSRSTPAPPTDPHPTPRSPSSIPIPASLSSIRGHSDQPRNSSPASAHSHRPSTFNRTIRHLLPHPRSSQGSSHPSPSIRKRWRSSRRFSKHPSPLPDLPDSTPDDQLNFPTSVPQSDPHDSTTDTATQPCHPQLATPSPRQTSSPSPSTHRTPSPTLPQTSNAPDPPSLEQSQSQPPDFIPPRLELPQNPTSHSLQVPELSQLPCPADEDVNDLPLDSKTNPPFVQGSSQDNQRSSVRLPSESRSHSSAFEPHPEPAPDPQLQLPRHFQSPGPLVVVQGVVNTSDNPAVSQTSANSRPSRPSSSGHPHSFISPNSRRRSISSPRNDNQSEERQTARRRLSAFIPRPSSMLGRRPPTPDLTSLPSHDPAFGDPSALFHAPSSDPLVPRDDASTSSEQDPGSSGEGDPRRRPLSPGSIDVLGTLLSVAAAATAASLFSPSLGFQPPADTNPPSLQSIPRPMSPTPTAGLGGGQGFGNLPGFGLDPSASISPSPATTTQHREGRERLRSVWENIRERLGLATPSSSRTGDETALGSEGQSHMRPGEIMLAEMARALNIGLGLNNDDSNAETSEMVASSAVDEGSRSMEDIASQRPLPPEDSFERFLLNLQADLRIALSDDSGDSTPLASGEDEAEGHASRDSDDGAASRRPPPDAPPTGLIETDDDVDEPPPLEEVSDSDDDDEDEDVVYRAQASVRTATPMPSAYSLPSSRAEQLSLEGTSGDESGNADRGQPGINLWRLYRFQPIPATQVAGHASTTTSPATPFSPTFASTTSSPSAPTVPQLPSSPGSPSSPSSPALPIPSLVSAPSVPTTTTPPGDATSSMVVPVIVVGLQSVDMGQIQGHGHVHPDPQMGPPSLHSDRRPTSFDSTGTAVPADGPNSATTRGRSWQSRAATALRNLRPGRRNSSSGRQASDSAGSRTFLIYVIGGYYPPNHHMVTGSDNLDSYEALWELAELLGQVKPPVATREEIDRSGLQIINSSELARYEQQGKVASNCAERCLICLDDYSVDEDLRLMSCKHAFHKECVDKWLQVGRNNCPACRTQVCRRSSLSECCGQ
ncbi:hypothetical protein V8D89_013170 [Ganoderma adspersum]